MRRHANNTDFEAGRRDGDNGPSPFGSAGREGATPPSTQPRQAKVGPVSGTGMYVSGYSSKEPSLYDKNPLAMMTIVVGFLAMLTTLIPNIGAYIAIPMGACTAVLGVLGILSAKKRGNDRGDIAVAGIVLGVASVAISGAALMISGNVLTRNGTDSIAIATESGDESLDALASMTAATDAFADISDSDWGTGPTRNESSEVIAFRKDMTFTGWTLDYDNNLSVWHGQYSLEFGKKAFEVIEDEAKREAAEKVMYDEIEKSPKFTERGLVAIVMDVNERDGDRSSPVRLIMIGHYIKDTHQLYMREASAPENTPTVMSRLDDYESGIT